MVEPLLHRTSSAILSLTIATMVGASLTAAPGFSGLLGALLALLMLSIAVSDFQRFLIPDELSAPAFALGLLHAAAAAPDAIAEAVAVAALRAAVGALVFFAIAKLYVLFRNRAGLGFGDVKLIVVAGAWLDWFALVIAIDVAVLAAVRGIAEDRVIAPGEVVSAVQVAAGGTLHVTEVV